MPAPSYLASSDPHLNPLVAATYDEAEAERFTAEALSPAVDALADLAGDKAAVEFAVGTGGVVA